MSSSSFVRRVWWCVLLSALCSGFTHAQGGSSFHAFDAPIARGVDVTPDGALLLVANRPGDSISVFRLTDPERPVLLREIPVGLQPVSVHARTDDEVWVVNGVSDTVSVVSLRAARVLESLRVVDEPGDVVFAGSPERAFVTATARNEVHVFDAETREPLAVIPIRGRDPRAMAASPDGKRVYVVSTRSGNGTTLVRMEDAPTSSTDLTGSLGPAPEQGIIVHQEDPSWESVAAMAQRDEDLFVIDADALVVEDSVQAVGTNLMGLDVDPRDGRVYVANSEANNLVRFESVLKGQIADHRVTVVDGAGDGIQAIWDLNRGLANDASGGSEGLARALADPVGLVVDPHADQLFVAAQGTDRIGVVTRTGVVRARIELSDAQGAAVDSRAKRGPRALVVHPDRPLLYVLNGLSNTVAVVSTQRLKLLREVSAGTDPTPADEKAGRGFLYDAKQSGNGTASCITCHVDLEWDALAWDLGVQFGPMQPKPTGQSFPFSIGLEDFHPLKGPMTTQFLRGLAGQAPFHWRGDRPDIRSFQSGFTALLGGPGLADDEWDDVEAYVESLLYQPNPNQNLDRSFDKGAGEANAFDGADFFFNTYIPVGIPVPTTCQVCHQLPTGSINFVLSKDFAVETEPMDQFKVPTLRSVYRRTNPADDEGYHLSGFGLMHDGQAATPSEVLGLGKLLRWPQDEVDDIAVYLEAFDTGAAPVLGYTVPLDATTVGDDGVRADWDLLETRAAAGDCDLVAQGLVDGLRRGLLFDVATGTYLPDDPGLAAFDRASLEAKAAAGEVVVELLAVGAGAGPRTALDRDEDGILNAVDGVRPYGSATPGCDGTAELFLNRAPALGDVDVTFAVAGAPETGEAWLLVGAAAASVPGVRGVELLVDPSAGLVLHELQRDGSGFPFLSVDVPRAPEVAGRTVYAQAVFEDGCGSEGWAATQALEVVIQQ